MRKHFIVLLGGAIVLALAVYGIRVLDNTPDRLELAQTKAGQDSKTDPTQKCKGDKTFDRRTKTCV